MNQELITQNDFNFRTECSKFVRYIQNKINLNLAKKKI